MLNGTVICRTRETYVANKHDCFQAISIFRGLDDITLLEISEL